MHNPSLFLHLKSIFVNQFASFNYQLFARRHYYEPRCLLRNNGCLQFCGISLASCHQFLLTSKCKIVKQIAFKHQQYVDCNSVLFLQSEISTKFNQSIFNTCCNHPYLSIRFLFIGDRIISDEIYQSIQATVNLPGYALNDFASCSAQLRAVYNPMFTQLGCNWFTFMVVSMQSNHLCALSNVKH